VTAERVARFHPTVGSVTSDRFTTSHPRARPRCFKIQSPTSSSTKVKDKGYSPPPLFIIPPYFQSSSGFSSAILVVRVLSPPSPHFLSCLFLQDCVWREFPHLWSGLRASTDGRFTPIPSLTLEEPPHLPSWWVIHSRVRELLWSLSK
jgi:hypothetical protein